MVDVAFIAGLTGKVAAPTPVAEVKKVKRRKRRAKRKRAWSRNKPTWKMGALLAAMQPGEWYARPDLLRLCPDLGYDYIKRKVVDWRGRGWLEQGEDPAWRPEHWKGFGNRLTPRYLFRLTERGAAERGRRVMLL